MRTALFLYLAERGADFLIAVKHGRRKGFQLIRDRLTYSRRIPWRTSKREIRRGRNITWKLRAMPAPEWVMEQWPGSATISALRSHGIREGKPQDETRYYVSSLRTGAKSLLRAIRQRWSIENSWHWVRDAPLREDAHRYRENNGVQILATLRSLAINALRLDGTWSITAGIAALAHDIKGLRRLLGWQEPATTASYSGRLLIGLACGPSSSGWEARRQLRQTHSRLEPNDFTHRKLEIKNTPGGKPPECHYIQQSAASNKSRWATERHRTQALIRRPAISSRQVRQDPRQQQ
ncbi:ISAs1 family transposase [Synechococcus sp. CB0101]|uniref:ISAs1 family transposase n=1 Tax=Synechococcus sp. CB0101 TaxID=232348 RepID=UPI000200130E|nr:ISAs1 family transposase [Synechococcus sp. CB0101]